ncbi:hypothetical protein FR483_n769L [Paramecium bursaria Chlorella virus FR483]|uniref:Uncharacterized protein n769L n=1 Tax=Paramecium bursaria Chlorella virus FR483 TaxID=399781 RepID=A7J8C3_PBCVF|nr:hypothetical protein FR483_n769L [Paramecium bursaria Chlorella virus FR483]ABT16054.1 hypothetical protein FR483_n769L [Paramecium bursaria Chlorella virus FR483]
MSGTPWSPLRLKRVCHMSSTKTVSMPRTCSLMRAPSRAVTSVLRLSSTPRRRRLQCVSSVASCSRTMSRMMHLTLRTSASMSRFSRRTWTGALM